MKKYLSIIHDLKRILRIRTRLRGFFARQVRISSRALHEPVLTERDQRIFLALQIRKIHGWSASRDAWNEIWRDKDLFPVASTKKILKPNARIADDFHDVEPKKIPERSIRWCIYTTLFDYYDTLQPVLSKIKGVDCICFSNHDVSVPGWKTVIVTSSLEGIRAAKEYKMRPHVYLNQYDASLFIDANTLVHGRIKSFIERWCIGYSFVMWRHSSRCDLYDEVDAILALQKDQPDIVIDQIIKYEKAGLPENSGLVEAGFIWRKHLDPVVSNLMNAWAAETRNGSSRDQLSLGWLMWKLKTRPKTIPVSLGNIRKNCVTAITAHRSMRPKSSNLSINVLSPVQKVCFLYEPAYKQSGSTVMRGKQLSMLLKERLSDRFDISFASRHDDVRDAILILTKGCTTQISSAELADLRRSNIGVVADFVDGEIRRDLLSLIDVVWAASISAFHNALSDITIRNVDLVTHHVDPRLPDPERKREFSVAYVGEPVNAVWSADISSRVDLLYVNTKISNDDWLNKVAKYPLHYAIRPALKSKSSSFKPFLKGFTAAHCNANVIANRNDSDVLSYLGEDYPYLTDGNSFDDAVRAIEYAHETFGGREWTAGLEVMREVRDRCSIDTIVKEVRRSLERF